jgi:hypothetical protein
VFSIDSESNKDNNHIIIINGNNNSNNNKTSGVHVSLQSGQLKA